MFSYDELISRNFLFLDKELQEKVRSTKLILAGCGLSSIIAEMAVRMGFTKFVLIDFDKVELSNLNRQAYNISNVGKNKCDALRDKLLCINPEIEVSVKNKKILNQTDRLDIISKGDVIINTIDYGEEYFALVHKAMEQNKLVICPFNPGFGGLVVCFNKDSGTLYDLLNTNKVEYGLEFDRKLIVNNLDITIPSELRNNLESFKEKILNSGYTSQICVGVNMSSSLAISCIIHYLLKKDIPYCPQVIFRGIYLGF